MTVTADRLTLTRRAREAADQARKARDRAEQWKDMDTDGELAREADRLERRAARFATREDN